jgi:hypothetical protein
MPSAPRYYLADSGRRTGPHSLAVLKQLAEVSTITPDTLHATESDPNDWSPLRDSQVLHDELFPARPHYTLDPHRPVEHVNRPDNVAVPTVDEMLRANLARQEASKGELLAPQPPRPNRRRSDFLFTVAAGAGASMFSWVFVDVTVGHIILTLGATAFVALCAAWVFYGVLDRY